MTTQRTVGVEEELHLLDPRTRRAAPAADDVMAGCVAPDGAQIEHEIKLSMIETGTSVCTSSADLLRDLRELRSVIVEAAAERDYAVASCGVLPTSDWQTSELVDRPRYADMADLYGQVFEEQVVCGLHVHVGIDDRDVAVEVLNRFGPWLPPLLALSASSPLFENVDTRFASYRTMVFGRWATAALPGQLASAEEHDRIIADIVATGTILDEGQIYWPVRLSSTYPTIEVRVADAVPTAEEACLQAVLVRAIVERLTADVEAGRDVRLPYTDDLGPPVRGELVRAATWQAARFGMEDDLLELRGGDRIPAFEAIDALVEQLRPELEQAGDIVLTHRLLDRVREVGAPATRIRAAADKGGAKAATDLLVSETTTR